MIYFCISAPILRISFHKFTPIHQNQRQHWHRLSLLMILSLTQIYSHKNRNETWFFGTDLTISYLTFFKKSIICSLIHPTSMARQKPSSSEKGLHLGKNWPGFVVLAPTTLYVTNSHSGKKDKKLNNVILKAW